MFCVKCGNQMPDESTYCDNCGSSVETQSQTETVEELKEEKPKKAKKKKWLFLFIPVVVIAALVICYFAFNICFSHEWTDATCTIPKTCSKCERTEGEALGHTWVEATCIVPKTCEVCGETEGEALGHIWEAATCTKSKTCSVCGETEGTSLKHIWVEATCIKPKHCSLCDVKSGSTTDHSFNQEGRCIWCDEYIIDGSTYDKYFKIEHEWIGAKSVYGGMNSAFINSDGYRYVGVRVNITPLKQGRYENANMKFQFSVKDNYGEGRRCFAKGTSHTIHEVEIYSDGYGYEEILIFAEKMDPSPDLGYVYPECSIKLVGVDGVYKK